MQGSVAGAAGGWESATSVALAGAAAVTARGWNQPQAWHLQGKPQWPRKGANQPQACHTRACDATYRHQDMACLHVVLTGHAGEPACLELAGHACKQAHAVASRECVLTLCCAPALCPAFTVQPHGRAQQNTQHVVREHQLCCCGCLQSTTLASAHWVPVSCNTRTEHSSPGCTVHRSIGCTAHSSIGCMAPQGSC